MRLKHRCVVNAPADLVWEIVADPQNYVHFMSGITRWEVEGDRREGTGMRIRMLISVGAAEIGGLIEVVEWSPPYELAWTSITGIDQRGRWRIRRRDDERSTVELRFAYGVAGSGIAGVIAERIGAREMNRHLRRSLLELKRRAETRSLEQRRAALTA